MHIVDVYLWGTKIGSIGYEPGQTEIATFQYDKNFISMNVEVSPLNVPINIDVHTFDNISQNTFNGLPGFIADSLPDKFGNQLIDQYYASKGKTQKDITALDRLMYVGDRAMGALEYRPTIEFETNPQNVLLDLQNLSELAELVLCKKNELARKLKSTDRQTAINLLRIGSSAGGARSKALIAIDQKGNLYDGTVNHVDIECRYYLLKFDNDSNSDRDNKDPKGMSRVEYIYSQIAKNCNIDIPNTSYIEVGNDFHFLIERFDRIDKSTNLKDKLHYVSWCGIAHAHRDTVGAYSYEQLVLTARNMKLGQDSIQEIFKRAVFNIVGRNQDDHTKNFGFLMDRNGDWSLSPAFDLTYSYDPSGKWTKVHQIRLNAKQDNFNIDDIISFGNYCGIKEKKSLEILEKTINEFSKFSTYADKYRVNNELKTTIINNLRTDLNKDNKKLNMNQESKSLLNEYKDFRVKDETISKNKRRNR